jgi:cytochrome c peroxidase
MRRLNEIPEYRRLFGQVFRDIRDGAPIDFDHFGLATAEFEFTLTFADAPIDRYARGNRGAMSVEQKKGALLFFGKAGCVSCHAVSGPSNQMFSDFQNHAIGVPQIAPAEANVTFDGPGKNEDFGLEQVTGDASDRYKFRTSPLRNVGLQPTFFHNGAFTRLEDAIWHHLNIVRSATEYSHPEDLAADLRAPMPPIGPVLDQVEPRMLTPVRLTNDEFRQLVEFVRTGLLDSRAKPQSLRRLIPRSVPSGRPVAQFE